MPPITPVGADDEPVSGSRGPGSVVVVTPPGSVVVVVAAAIVVVVPPPLLPPTDVVGPAVVGGVVAGGVVGGAVVPGAVVGGAVVPGAVVGGVVVGATVVVGAAVVVVTRAVQSPWPVASFVLPLVHVPHTVSDVPEKLTVVEPPAGMLPEWPWSVVNVSAVSDCEFTICQTPGD